MICFIFCQNWSLIFLKKDPKTKIIPLSLFQQNMDKGVKTWLTKIADPLKFMDNILCITYPTLYDTAYKVMNKLKADPITGKYTSLWPTVYLDYLPSQTEHLENIGITLEPISGMIKLSSLDHMS